MDTIKSSARTTDEEIRLDAAVHPERAYREHVAAAQRIAAVEYRRDLAKISPAGWDAYHADLQADEDEMRGV